MRTILASFVFVVVTAAGCGGKGKSETTADPCKDPCNDKMMEHHEGEGHEGEEHNLTPEMSAFHDVLAPLWHAEVGPDRTSQTCAESGHMLDLANDIQNASAPERADSESWANAVRDLMLAITALQDSCPDAANGVTPDDAFAGVHEAFHGLMELIPAP